MLRGADAFQGVTGYAQSLLVMERFGYPDFLLATADQLIEHQYADRPQLRPIYDAIIGAATTCGDVIIQARKTYVSLVSPRRTRPRATHDENARRPRVTPRWTTAQRTAAGLHDSRDHAYAENS